MRAKVDTYEPFSPSALLSITDFWDLTGVADFYSDEVEYICVWGNFMK